MEKCFLSNKKAITLIEIILSIALLGIISIMLLPIIAFTLNASNYNQNQETARQIAANQINWLRSLDYHDELGLDLENYSPKGIVDTNLYMNREETSPYVINGVNYYITTRVYWDDTENVDGIIVPDASKKVDVIVESNNPFTKEVAQVSVLGTLISFEGERLPSNPGVMIKTYWRNYNQPQPQVQVELDEQSGPRNYRQFTDQQGRVIIIFEGERKDEGLWELGSLSWTRGTGRLISSPVKALEDRWEDKREIALDFSGNNFYEEEILVDFPGLIKIINLDEVMQEVQDTGMDIAFKILPEDFTLPEGVGIEHITIQNQDLHVLNNLEFWTGYTYKYSISKDLEDSEREYELAIQEASGNWKPWEGGFEQYSFKETLQELQLVMMLKEETVSYNLKDQVIELILPFSSELGNIDHLGEASFPFAFMRGEQSIDLPEYKKYESVEAMKEAWTPPEEDDPIEFDPEPGYVLEKEENRLILSIRDDELQDELQGLEMGPTVDLVILETENIKDSLAVPLAPYSNTIEVKPQNHTSE
ncbi:type II secretion system protein [Tindallia californiensis]|uniref:Prepilin-type N-terminal cleavage/methylation domain-containing protein n=1 Tax=Tindallia californiensis TaxID=159292 RepID=A0A1H3NHP4_9FIRM|nr:type II secretion system protein [Tindallia californiensis]SDY88411.1 hypothetical protein SAMN05192546_105128 [Tindallia californiensis]